MAEENVKSIFTRRSGGGRSLSIFDKPTQNCVTNDGRVNIRRIAEQVRKNGSVSFEHGPLQEGPPLRAFQRRFGRSTDDTFDMRDPNPPQNDDTDMPSQHFHKCVRMATVKPVACNTLEPITVDGAVRKRILKEGTGPSDTARDGCRVWIHYDMYLVHENGSGGVKLTFKDSTYDHEMACSLELGQDGILGLQLGVKSMRLFEIAEFSIRAEYGYGKNGIIGWIGKNQTLRVIVELKEVKEKHRKPLTLMTEVEREEVAKGMGLEELLQEVEQLVKAANGKFEKRLYWDACDRYNWALDLIREFKEPQKKRQFVLDQQQFRILSNLALCLLRREEFVQAEECCREALALQYHAGNLKPKVLYRLAMALYKQNKFLEAKDQCLVGLKQGSWGHVEFRDLKFRAESAFNRWQARERLDLQNQRSNADGSPNDQGDEE